MSKAEDIELPNAEGSSAPLFTAEQHANFRLDCELRAARSAYLEKMREARRERGGAMSNAERQREFVARANDLRHLRHLRVRANRKRLNPLLLRARVPRLAQCREDRKI